MASLFLEVAVRAALIAAGTAVVLWALRIKAPAVRHAAWTAVLLAMLLLPIGSLSGLQVAVPVLPARAGGQASPTDAVTAPPPTTVAPVGAATTAPATTTPLESGRQIDWPLAFLAVYATGVFVLLVRLAIGTVQAHRLRSHALMQAGQATSDRCTTPVTIGVIAPVIILPPDWQHWPGGKLHAVLTHEREHVRRHDTLVQWLALFNRAVFWIHPLAWWLERRLATLAEEACDAAVLAAGHSPQDYSTYLLDFARSALREGRRVRTVGMAMPGGMLRSRLGKILDGMSNPVVSRSRAACAIAFCTLSSVLFAAGMPSARAAISQAQEESGMAIKFEVVSIKPCEGFGDPNARGGGPGTARSMISPGYAFLACQTLNQLIDMAWGGGSFPTNWLLNTIRVPPGIRPDLPKRVRGGPSWANEDRFSLEIRMSGDTTDKTGSARHDVVANAMAPAMRALLEDRFQLKLRKATEQVPMYAMTVAAGGLKIPQTAKPGEQCWVPLPATSRAAEPVAPPGSEGLPPCNYRIQGRNNGGNKVSQFSHISLKAFAKELSETVDRYVLDETSIEGRFSFTLEYAPDERTPGDTYDPFARIRRERSVAPPPTGAGPSIFKAVELLGLKLAPTKGPAEYLQIESVQRPRPDFAAVAASSDKPDAPVGIVNVPARATGSGGR